MEKNDIYYYEKDGETYAVKKISEYDIDYSIHASHHAYRIWNDMRVGLSRKLKYYSLQEDGFLYFEMKQSLPSSILSTLTIDDTICDKTIYNVPKGLVKKCADIFLSEDKKKVLWVYTDKSRFCDSSYMRPYYGKASVYDLASYLADNQYRMMLNEKMFFNLSEVYAICDYPVYKGSISCEIRDIHEMCDTGHIMVSPERKKNDLMKEFKERLHFHKTYQMNECLDIAIDVSDHIKDYSDEISSIINISKEENEKGNYINLFLCVKNKKQKETVGEMIDGIIHPVKNYH